MDEADFITPEEIKEAKSLADQKFLTQDTGLQDRPRIHTYIVRHEGDDWVVRTRDGKKVLGRHKTKADADAQLRAIEANK